ncbi:MAG: hypothetical protein IJX99_04050 [Clostridia bacterium]|nr:hypothetical protein [Clostridia bacterium]
MKKFFAMILTAILTATLTFTPTAALASEEFPFGDELMKNIFGDEDWSLELDAHGHLLLCCYNSDAESFHTELIRKDDLFFIYDESRNVANCIGLKPSTAFALKDKYDRRDESLVCEEQVAEDVAYIIDGDERYVNIAEAFKQFEEKFQVELDVAMINNHLAFRIPTAEGIFYRFASHGDFCWAKDNIFMLNEEFVQCIEESYQQEMVD